MSPSWSVLFCLGLCLGQVIPTQNGPLPKPSLQALPSRLVPLEKPVTIRCQGPPGVDLYRLEKLSSGKYEDQPVLFIPAMKRSFAGRYRCSYQNGTRWSPPSDQLELVATGVSAKPSLSAQSSTTVSPGGEVTLQCRNKDSLDQFALYKKGDAAPYKGPERWYLADFPIITVTVAHSGTYQCYSFSSTSPYLWSAPSDPLELVVIGTSVTPSLLPTEAPSSVTGWTQIPRNKKYVEKNQTVPTFGAEGSMGAVTAKEAKCEESSRNTIAFPKGSSSPTGFTDQDYTKGNLVRICFGAVILIFLAGLLVEDWHSRKKYPWQWVRAVHRPLPPLPQTQKAHRCQDRDQPDGHNHGCLH